MRLPNYDLGETDASYNNDNDYWAGHDASMLMHPPVVLPPTTTITTTNTPLTKVPGLMIDPRVWATCHHDKWLPQHPAFHDNNFRSEGCTQQYGSLP